ncbi:MAG TPA: FMN-binding protein [Streptosporangiaceae bacterium]|jgi:uncharacterized protein with FMN-binding domain
MRRAILTIGGTAAGLAALLSFKTHTSVADVADPGVAPRVSAAASPTTSAVPSTKPKAMASSKASPAKMKSTASAGSGGSMTTRTITGAVETTLYGPMQVKVTLEGTKITNVAVVQETNDGQESQQIDSFSIPKLTAETLTAQSARIDAVSGATATSSGYIGSLQNALDQATA